MATTTCEHVGRGDLITAEFMNCVLDRLKTVEEKVVELEDQITPGQTLTITRVEPTGSVAMGTELKVYGKNFDLPTLSMAVSTVPVTAFKSGSNDQLLKFDVPVVPGIVSDTPVLLTMSCSKGSATWPLIIRPGEASVLTGTLAIRYVKAPTTINLDPGTHIFGFKIIAKTSKAWSYTLAARILNQSGWSANVVGSTQIDIPQSPSTNPTELDVNVTVTIPGATANGVLGHLDFSIEALDWPSMTSTYTTDLKVGDPPPAPPGPVWISLSKVTRANIVDGVIVLEPDKKAGIFFKAHIEDKDASESQPVMYTIVGPTIENDPNSLWVPEFNMSSRDFPVPSANWDYTINTALTGSAGAPSARLILRVSRKDKSAIFDEMRSPIQLKA